MALLGQEKIIFISFYFLLQFVSFYFLYVSYKFDLKYLDIIFKNKMK